MAVEKFEKKPVENFIGSAGTQPDEDYRENFKKNHGPEVAFQIRVGKNIISDMEKHMACRRSRISRNSWIVEAICEKLNRKP